MISFRGTRREIPISSPQNEEKKFKIQQNPPKKKFTFFRFSFTFFLAFIFISLSGTSETILKIPVSSPKSEKKGEKKHETKKMRLLFSSISARLLHCCG
jgi:hypothetical protein